MSIVIDDPAAVERLSRFATSHGLTPDEAILQAIDDPDDPAALATPHPGPRVLSSEAAARIRSASGPSKEVIERWKAVAANYKRLTGGAENQ